MALVCRRWVVVGVVMMMMMMMMRMMMMKLCLQVHVQVTWWLSHVFRLYEGARVVEFEWEAGPLPTDDGGLQVR